MKGDGLGMLIAAANREHWPAFTERAALVTEYPNAAERRRGKRRRKLWVVVMTEAHRLVKPTRDDDDERGGRTYGAWGKEHGGR